MRGLALSLLMMPADDYPTLPSNPEPTGSVDGHLVTQAVAQVSVAADRGDTLPILTGVRVEVNGDTMTLLATDRYRWPCASCTGTPPTPTPATSSSSRPARCPRPPAASGPAAASTSRWARPPAATGSSGSRPGRRTTTRLLDGEYPKVASIFPTTSDTEAVIKTSELVEAVKRVAPRRRAHTPRPAPLLRGQVAIEAGTGEDAQASEAVECALTGPEIEIAFNPGYLLDGLGAVGTDWSRISFHPGLAAGGPVRPARGGRRGRHLLPLRPHAGPLRLLIPSAPRG